MNTYITGKNGFIGFYLSKQLKEVSLEFSFEDLILRQAPKIVVHGAAIVGSKKCEDNPEQACISNVLGTWKIANWAKDSYFVNLSSIAVYQFDKTVSFMNSITEKSRIYPHTWYGWTKLLGEHICQTIFGERFLNLRLGFIYGSPERDLHSLISMCLKHQKVALVGNYSKDYLYIDDCVDAIQYLIERRAFGTYNLGSGKTFSVQEILDCLEVKEFEFDARDYFGSFVIDISKIQQLGWQPKHEFWSTLKRLKENQEASGDRSGFAGE